LTCITDCGVWGGAQERRRVEKMEARQKKEVATLLAAELRRAQLEEQQSKQLQKKQQRMDEEAAMRELRRKEWEAANVRHSSVWSGGDRIGAAKRCGVVVWWWCCVWL
jgi:hypothetical protein